MVDENGIENVDETDAAPDLIIGDPETEVNNEGDTIVDAPDVNVTVVSADSDGGDSETNIDHEHRITMLEATVSELQGKIFAVEIAQVVNEVEGEVQDEEIEEVQEEEEETEEEVESAQDGEPGSAKPHPLFRSFGSWRGRE